MRSAIIEHPTSQRYRYNSPLFSMKLRLIYRMSIFLLFTGSAAMSYFFKFNLQGIGLTILSSIIIGFSLYHFCKKIVTGSVNGDYLILTHRLTNKSKVVDIKHLRKVRSARFLWLRGTQFTYNLDGDVKRVVLLCNSAELTHFTKLVRELKKAA